MLDFENCFNIEIFFVGPGKNSSFGISLRVPPSRWESTHQVFSWQISTFSQKTVNSYTYKLFLVDDDEDTEATMNERTRRRLKL